MSLLLLLRGGSGGGPTPRSVISQIPDALLGTGKKILVFYNNGIQERAASEGVPLVLVGGVLRELLSTETLQQ